MIGGKTMTECTVRTLPAYAQKDHAAINGDSARSYLESYLIYSKMLDMRVCEEQTSSKEDEESRRAVAAYEIVCIKTRMREIEDFIESLDIENKWLLCKIFLKYHYILGYTIEECSEKMYVSRSTAYRLKKRALRFAAEQFSA